VKTPELIVDFNGSKTFSVVRLRENIRLGQRIEAFALDVWINGDWKEIATATSIGPSRLIRLTTPQTTSRLRASPKRRLRPRSPNVASTSNLNTLRSNRPRTVRDERSGRLDPLRRSRRRIA
jgi:hypothetical protein